MKPFVLLPQASPQKLSFARWYRGGQNKRTVTEAGREFNPPFFRTFPDIPVRSLIIP
ncbi:hypothetical protein [Desertivirga brevis]|uniref:hypothetical protein n=1 Tax=Desertivirga brevis TaxID=2810310 RepID=UPI001A9733BE|nr:hypothetical protein [Pedobacter sp. SYSU D00873]